MDYFPSYNIKEGKCPPMPAAFEGSSFLLTYPQSPSTKKDLFTFLCALTDIQYVKLCQETHQDGHPHFHALLHFSKRQRLAASYFDLDSHPNVKNVGRKKSDWSRVSEYLDKEDQSPLTWGTPRHTQCIWSEVVRARSRQEAIDLVTQERPRDLVLNGRNLDYFLDKVRL